MGIPRSPRRRPLLEGAAQDLPPDTTRLDLDTLRRGAGRPRVTRRGAWLVGEPDEYGSIPVMREDGTVDHYTRQEWMDPEPQPDPVAAARAATETAAFDARSRAAEAQRRELEALVAQSRARDLARSSDAQADALGQRWAEEDAYAQAAQARGALPREAEAAALAAGEPGSATSPRTGVTVTREAPQAVEVIPGRLEILDGQGRTQAEATSADAAARFAAQGGGRPMAGAGVPDGVPAEWMQPELPPEAQPMGPVDDIAAPLTSAADAFAQARTPVDLATGAHTEQAAQPGDVAVPAEWMAAAGGGVSARGGGTGGVRGGGRRAPVAAQPQPVDENQATLDALMQPGVMQQAFPEDYAATSPQATQRGLIDRQRQLAQRRFEALGGGIAQQQDALAAQEQQRRDIAQRQQMALGQARQRYTDAVRRAGEMRVDPDHWWADRGIGGSIAAAIAIGMGSFGEAFGGGPNVAAQMIREAIDQDIAAQRDNIDNAWQAAEGERGVYGLIREGFDDETAANAAATAASLQQAQLQVQQQMAGLDSEEARLNAEELINQLEIQRQQAEAEAIRGQAEWALEAEDTMSRIEARRARTALAQQQYARRAGGGGAARPQAPRRGAIDEMQRLMEANFQGGRTEENAAAYDAYRARLEELYGIPRPVGAGPELGLRGTPQLMATARGLNATLSELENVLDTAAGEGRGTVGTGGVGPFDANLYPDWAASMLGDEEQLRVSQLRQDVVSAYTQLRSGAQVSDRERALYDAFLSATTLDQMRGSLRALRSELGARVGGEMRTSRSERATAEADAEDEDLLDEDQ